MGDQPTDRNDDGVTQASLEVNLESLNARMTKMMDLFGNLTNLVENQQRQINILFRDQDGASETTIKREKQ